MLCFYTTFVHRWLVSVLVFFFSGELEAFPSQPAGASCPFRDLCAGHSISSANIVGFSCLSGVFSVAATQRCHPDTVSFSVLWNLSWFPGKEDPSFRKKPCVEALSLHSRFLIAKKDNAFSLPITKWFTPPFCHGISFSSSEGIIQRRRPRCGDSDLNGWVKWGACWSSRSPQNSKLHVSEISSTYLINDTMTKRKEILFVCFCWTRTERKKICESSIVQPHLAATASTTLLL